MFVVMLGNPLKPFHGGMTCGWALYGIPRLSGCGMDKLIGFVEFLYLGRGNVLVVVRETNVDL